MAVSVADLAKHYADTPPPKYNTLADLETRLEELRTPGYRSPFKFDASSGVGPFGTTGYGTIGTYGSGSEFLKAAAPHVASLHPVHRTGGLAAPFTTPLWEQLSEKRGTSPWSINVGKVQYDRGTPFGGVLEALRSQLERLGVFVGGLPAGLERTLKALRSMRPLDPYGNPVPLDNMWLYSLARRAYQGDYVARAAFLDEIGADESADNVYFLDVLLRPTFDPAPQDLGGRRCAWEQLAPEKARGHLLGRLHSLKVEDGRIRGVNLPWEDERGEERVSEEDLALFALEERELFQARREKLRSALDALPERRLQVAQFRAEGLTAEQIATRLAISSSSVRTHMQLLRQDEALKKLHRR